MIHKQTTVKKIAYLFLLCCQLSMAQSTSSDSNFIGADKGLSHPYVTFKFEDSKGFLWLSTFGGVNRWDGAFMKVYSEEDQFENGPVLQQAYGFAEDDKGHVYTGGNFGLYEYIREKDSFTVHRIYQGKESQPVIPFAFRDQKIWCFSKDFTLISMDVITHKVTFYNQLKMKEIPSFHLYQSEHEFYTFRFPFFDKNGLIWAVDTKKLASFSINTKQATYYNIPEKEAINGVFYDELKHTIVVNTKKNAFVFDVAKTQFTQQISITEPGDTNSYSFIMPLKKSWIIIKDAHCIITKAYSNIAEVEQNEFNTAIKKCNLLVYFYIDRKNRLWFNSHNGLTVFSPEEHLLQKESLDNNSEENLKYGVLSFASKNDSILFVASPNRINQYNIKTKKFGNPYFKSNDLTYRIADDPNKDGVWMFATSHYNRHIKFFNRKTQQEIVIPYANDIGTIQDIVSVSPNLTLLTSTLGIYTIKNNVLSAKPILQKTESFKINVLENNLVAISFTNSEMILYRISHTGLQPVQTVLPGIISFYIIKSPKGEGYFAGTNQGLYYLNTSFKKVKKVQGISGNYMYGLANDKENNVWVSHQNGLSRINATNLSVVNFDESDGIQDKDFNNRSFYKHSDGSLFFGGGKGFNRINGKLNYNFYYQPKLYVEAITINNGAIKSDRCADLITDFQTDYDRNDISFHVVVRDLQKGYKLKIAYKLEGLDSGWQFLPNNSIIRFNNLNSGNYKLNLGYFNPYLNTIVFQKQVHFTVKTPFWRSILFWILSSMLLTWLVARWIINRKNYLKRKELENQILIEKQKQNLIADLHDEIGSTLSSLQINSTVAKQLLQNDVNAATEIVKKIEHQSKSLSEKIGDIIWSMKPGKDEFMSLSTRIKNFCNEIIGTTNINYTLDIDKKIDSEIQDITFRKNILLLCKEAVNNAVKYSQASHIQVILALKESKLHVLISDDGIGFDVSVISGNGVTNIKNRVAELNGKCVFQSEKNKGTSLIIEIPIT